MPINDKLLESYKRLNADGHLGHLLTEDGEYVIALCLPAEENDCRSLKDKFDKFSRAAINTRHPKTYSFGYWVEGCCFRTKKNDETGSDFFEKFKLPIPETKLTENPFKNKEYTKNRGQRKPRISAEEEKVAELEAMISASSSGPESTNNYPSSSSPTSSGATSNLGSTRQATKEMRRARDRSFPKASSQQAAAAPEALAVINDKSYESNSSDPAPLASQGEEDNTLEATVTNSTALNQAAIVSQQLHAAHNISGPYQEGFNPLKALENIVVSDQALAALPAFDPLKALENIVVSDQALAALDNTLSTASPINPAAASFTASQTTGRGNGSGFLSS